MASTYTTNLGIEKIGTGEQSGTWGDTTNTNLDLIDEAVNGIIAITLSSAGSSGSPTALPITDGASSNGRNKFIEFVDGGDLGGTAYVQLTPNNAEKIVHIRNSLSGSRSVIVFQGTYNASNDFEIVSGADVLLKFNGGGSGATVTDVNVDLTVTGATIATADINGGAIDGTTIGGSSAAVGTFTTANATTVDTTNLEVTNLKAKDGTAAGSIAGSTGVVTVASAVLTTADINGGTADGVTIGGSTAAAGTFTTFTSTGIDDNATSTAITIDANENVGISNTTPSSVNAAASALVVGDTDGNYGMTIMSGPTSAGSIHFGDTFETSSGSYQGVVNYSHDTNKMSFFTSAQPRLTVDGSGNVGIGTNAPNISGGGATTTSLTVSASGSNANGILELKGTRFAGSVVSYVRSYNNSGATPITDILSYSGPTSPDTTGELAFHTSNSEAMRIDRLGNVGIGTPSPAKTLDVTGTSRITGEATFGNDVLLTNSGYVYSNAGGSGVRAGWLLDGTNQIIKGMTGGTERMRIDASGNVVVGGNGNAYSAGSTTLTSNGGISNSSPSGVASSINICGIAGISNGFQINSNTSNQHQYLFFNGTTVAVKIDTSGNFLVGKTSANAAVAGAELRANGQINSTINADTYQFFNPAAGLYRFYVSSAGVIHATSTSITGISDESLKENVRDLDSGLDAIKALRPRRFDWKNGDGSDVMGFIAQEVEEVMPELVEDHQYNNEEVKKGLRMGDMIPSLVKAMQEQQAMIETLQAEVAALKGA